MARRSLKPQLNQIRTWVRQGRTDAWIAHQLEVSVRDIDQFKRDHELAPAETPVESPGGVPGPVVEELPDLRAEDDSLIAAELDAEPDEPPVEEAPAGDDAEDEDAGTRRRRRGRRGGRGRRKGGTGRGGPLEGTFDHGEEGYGLWLDPSVQDDPVYAEHWAGHRPVTVTVEAERIVIERSGADATGAANGDSGEAVADTVTSGGSGTPSEP